MSRDFQRFSQEEGAIIAQEVTGLSGRTAATGHIGEVWATFAWKEGHWGGHIAWRSGTEALELLYSFRSI